jgi:hypothetical protein
MYQAKYHKELLIAHSSCSNPTKKGCRKEANNVLEVGRAFRSLCKRLQINELNLYLEMFCGFMSRMSADKWLCLLDVQTKRTEKLYIYMQRPIGIL